jgi:hypothetical protein
MDDKADKFAQKLIRGRISVSEYHGLHKASNTPLPPLARRSSLPAVERTLGLTTHGSTARKIPRGGPVAVVPIDERIVSTDARAIQGLSYCPDLIQIGALCDRGRVAVTNPFFIIKSAVFVKGCLNGPTSEAGPVPTAVENILAKSPFFSRGTINGVNAIPLGNDGDAGPFAFIRDLADAPYHGNSMGLIGVLKTFHESIYGTLRINLFQGKLNEYARQSLWQTIQVKDINRVREMLVDFLNFRDTHVFTLMSETVKHMNEKGMMLSRDHKAIRDILHYCAEAADFSHTGMGVVSFCQCWEVNQDGTVTNRPSFSIASPHFQTRFYVRDGVRLKLYLSGFLHSYHKVDAMFERYQVVMDDLDRRMKNTGYTKSFVNLDTLKMFLGAGSF